VGFISDYTGDGEPSLETGQGGGQDSDDDNNGGMTIDFGFVPEYDLASVKDITSLSPAPVENGAQLTFTVTVMNQGTWPSGTFTVTDTLPVGVT